MFGFQNKRWLVVIIVIVILIIVIIIISQVKVCPEINKPTLPLNEIIDDLKTGDVIASHGCHFARSAMMRKYLGCKATHVAMVIRKPDDLYTIEIGPHSFNPMRTSDVKIMKLTDFLKKGKHEVFALIPTPREIEWSDEDELRYQDIKFNYFVPTMFAPYKNYKVCSTFIAKIHEDKGLLTPEMEGKHHLVSPCSYYDSPDTIFFTR